jgi:hypothetical protein
VSNWNESEEVSELEREIWAEFRRLGIAPVLWKTIKKDKDSKEQEKRGYN